MKKATNNITIEETPSGGFAVIDEDKRGNPGNALDALVGSGNNEKEAITKATKYFRDQLMKKLRTGAPTIKPG